MTIRSSDYWHEHSRWLTNDPNHLVIIHRSDEAIGLGRYSVASESASIKEICYVEELASFPEVFAQTIRHICCNGVKPISAGYFTPQRRMASLDSGDMEIRYSDNQTLRMRLINVRALFSNMLPQLTKRLKARGITQYENCITIRCKIGGAALRIRQSRLDILEPEAGTVDVFLQ